MERDLHFSILVDSAPLIEEIYGEKALFEEGVEHGRERDATAQARHPEIRLRSRKVKSRKQAIAIGLSEARAKGAKVPRKRAGRKSSRKAGARKR